MTGKKTSRTRILAGSAIVVVVVGLVAVLFVLPSEYGIDPTGFGKMAGLTKISEAPTTSPELERGAKRTDVLTLVEGDALPTEPGAKDHWEWELGPYEAIEFKYTLPEGAVMAFRWRTPVPVRVDMHAHPFVGGTALTESYKVGDTAGMQGRYKAAFTGIHGWYWQNRTLERVKVTLDASGGFTGSTIFDSAGEHKRAIGG
jgi:hypothetical protein